jgi:altered-inheritance-of-mitochondria protein 5
VTLTLGIAYLTVYSHERNRQAQALYLRSQHQLLNSLVEPTPVQPSSRTELARQSRSTFTETAKDRWNDEVENAVRWVQSTDWNGVREGMEGAVARLLGLGLQKSREGIEEAEKQAGPKVQDAVDRSKAAARKGAEQTAAVVDRAATATIASAERASGATKSGLDKAATTTREGLDKAGAKVQDVTSSTKASAKKAVAGTKAEMENAATSIRSAVDRGIEKSHEVVDKAQTEAHSTGTGTVDAARGALRNVVSKGIEKGKEVIGKAQEAVGLATEKAQSVSQGKTPVLKESDVEKAMRERYETPKGFDRSAEEVLEERYKPVEQRDNTVLRGI